ncbi:MAG: FAD-linked oxidase C-terminal domain-containing protein [Rhizomicrobium sp.]
MAWIIGWNLVLIKNAASEAIVANGGTISHHHGVGEDHLPWIAREKGAHGIDVLRAGQTNARSERHPQPRKAYSEVSAAFTAAAAAATASRALGMMPRRLKKPWNHAGVIHIGDWHIRGIELVGIGFALVAQRIEACSYDIGGGKTGQIGGPATATGADRYGAKNRGSTSA